MTTNVDAVYAPDLSTRYAWPVFLGRLAAGCPSPAPPIDLARKTVTLEVSGGLGERNIQGNRGQAQGWCAGPLKSGKPKTPPKPLQ
jgi:hypothetical protein